METCVRHFMSSSHHALSSLHTLGVRINQNPRVCHSIFPDLNSLSRKQFRMKATFVFLAVVAAGLIDASPLIKRARGIFKRDVSQSDGMFEISKGVSRIAWPSLTD